ncbi:MAG: hypothetical protein V7745_06415 [Pseudomonadales bacterium]
MNVIIQEEKTGCGIASVANIVGLSYEEVKNKANSIGIFAKDESLYSDTGYVRKLLNEYAFNTSDKEVSFNSWDELPNLALLAIKYHLEAGKPYWHWVVFKREKEAYVLDSASYLEKNKITNLSGLTPKWYIAVTKI